MFRRIFKIISHLSAKSDQENERERMSGSAMAVQRVSERARGRRERAKERGQFKVGHKFVRQIKMQIKIQIHFPTE